MAITRIQNNQITDNTIQANAKVTPGSITGNLFASSVTLNSNITILGNLTVSNNYTQLNSVNTYIGDPLVVFNNGYVGTPSYDVGLLVNRNLYATPPYGSVNAAFVWKEADTAFEALMTTETGTTAGAINNSGFANVKVGNLTAVSQTVSGAVSFGSLSVTNGTTLNGATQINSTLGVTGAVNITNTSPTALSVSGSGVFGNNISVGGNLSVTGNINVTSGNVTINNSAFFVGNTITGIGAVYAGIPSGYAIVPNDIAQFSGSINGYAQVNFQNINNGNQATTDYIATANNGTDTTYYVDLGIAGSGYDNTIPNNSLGNVLFPNDAYLYAQGNLSTQGGGNLVIGTTTDTKTIKFITGGININRIVMSLNTPNTLAASPATGSMVVQGGAGISGVLQVGGNIVAASGTASTNTTTGALIVSGGAGISGAVYAGSIQNTPIGSTTASSGAFTTITSSSTIISSGNVVANSGTASTTTASGALVVVGGAGISGAIYAGSIQNTPIGSTTPSTGAFTTLTTTSTFTSSGNLVASSGTASSSTTTGALVVVGGIGASGALNLGGAATLNSTLTVSGVTTSNGNLVAASGTASTNTTTGALVVTGGAGISGAVNAAGVVTLSNSTDSSGTGVGALVVSGGVGIAKNLNVGGSAVIAGNLTVNGTFEYINSTVTTHEDPILELNTGASGAALTSSNGNDAGIRTHYYASGADQTAFFGRTNDAGNFEYYSAVSSESGNVITGTYGTIKSGQLLLANSTASTNTTTGALQVTGGAGIQGAIYAGSIQNTPIGSTTPNTGAFTTLTTTQTIISSGNIVAASGTASTNTTSGALVVTGGAGISGALNVGGISAFTGASTFTSTVTANGNIIAASGTASTNTTTGAAVVVGGLGVSGAIYAGSIQNTPIGATTASTGAFTTLTSSSTFIASGNIVAASGTASTNTTSGALVVTGGLGVSGAINAGTLTVNGATQLSSTLNVTSTATVNGNLVAAATTASTSTTTGALVVTGGVGIAGNIYSGGNQTVANGFYSTGSYAGPYSDGVIVDYATGLGRLSVGGADGLKVYNNGVGVTELFVIDATGNIVIPATTTSTSTSTGALTVKGGVGVAGAIIAGGNIVAGSGTNTTSTTTGAMTVVGGAGISGNLFVGGGVTLNSAKTANYDVTINGKNDTTLFWARSGNAYDQIVIGNSATTSTLVTGAKVIINTTDSIMVPAGTNAQRPGNAGGTDTAGMVRFNTTSANLEYYNGTGWMNTGTTFTIIADDQLTGNGSTSYTLGGSVSTNGALVSINGVIQIPTLAYSISGTTITFTEAVQAGDIIDVRRMSTTQQITGITSPNGYMGFSADNNGAYVNTGTNSSNTTATTYWDPTGGEVCAVANVLISSSGVATGVDSFSATAYRTAKYIIQATNGSNYESKEVLLVQNGSTAYLTQYGTVNTGSSLGVITASVNAGVVTLSYNANNNNTTIRLRKEYMLI